MVYLTGGCDWIGLTIAVAVQPHLWIDIRWRNRQIFFVSRTFSVFRWTDHRCGYAASSVD